MGLSKAQQKMVRDNHNLIMSYILRHNLGFNEYYDVLAIVLCKAAELFNAERGIAFSTYVYKAMDNAYRMSVRSTVRSKDVMCACRESLLSLDEIVSEAEDSTLYDVIPSKNHRNEANAIGVVLINEFLSVLKPSEQSVLLYRLDDYSQAYISSALGITKQRVSQICTRIKTKWRLFSLSWQ